MTKNWYILNHETGEFDIADCEDRVLPMVASLVEAGTDPDSIVVLHAVPQRVKLVERAVEVLMVEGMTEYKLKE